MQFGTALQRILQCITYANPAFAPLANTQPVASPAHPFPPAPLAASMDLPAPTTFHPRAIWPFNTTPPTTGLKFTDVYFNNFMVLSQCPHHNHVMNNLLHHLNSVFQDPANSPRRLVVS
jgi:hypothetical protein